MSQAILKWFMIKLRKTRDKTWIQEITIVLPENKFYHSTPKISMEEVTLMKKLGCIKEVS